ncbi:MAG: V-type ATP synthase subunit E [Desulfoarculaceae bacterium]|nr:V-type ATP synthase subunit E [Desulfoarculaceae bacterium]
MSHSALIDDLRARGEQQIVAMRRQAREEIDGLRSEADHRLTEAETCCRLTTDQSRETVRRKMAVTAQRQASAIATRAEQELSNRLYGLAKALLNGLPGTKRSELFTRLAGEITAGDWQTITVHPEDTPVARKLFPQAEIVTDGEITGGLVASTADGGITIINTLEKRLERLWPGLVSEIIREVVDNEQAA